MKIEELIGKLYTSQYFTIARPVFKKLVYKDKNNIGWTYIPNTGNWELILYIHEKSNIIHPCEIILTYKGLSDDIYPVDQWIISASIDQQEPKSIAFGTDAFTAMKNFTDILVTALERKREADE